MSIIRILIYLAGLITAVFAALVAFFVRNMVRPPQQEVWTTPAELDMAYEDVQFSSKDGVHLSGWFIPGNVNGRHKGDTVVMAHGWLANRLGGQGKSTLAKWSGVRGLNVLPLVYALHLAGFNVMMFDFRNHGESASASPVTFGKRESSDLLSAIDYAANHEESDPERICVIGISMGANTTIFTLPQTTQIKAAVAAQPVTAAVFNESFARTLLGSFAPVFTMIINKVYKMAGGPAMDELRPANAAAQAGDTPVLYIQGTGDPWGSVADVQGMADATAGADGVMVAETKDRIEGYEFAINNPELIIDFFEKHLK